MLVYTHSFRMMNATNRGNVFERSSRHYLEAPSVDPVPAPVTSQAPTQRWTTVGEDIVFLFSSDEKAALRQLAM